MYSKIISTVNVLRSKDFIYWDDMTFVFETIIKYAKDNDIYYLNSPDYELFDFSLEYSWGNNNINDVFRASYFWTNLDFLKEIFFKFWYTESLRVFLSVYKEYLPFLKDNLVTCGFKFFKWNLVELKVYFDTKKSKQLLTKENVGRGLDTIKSEILLKSFTFNKNECLEEKLYIPPDEDSLVYAEKLLQNNNEYPQFQNSDYYDILYRYYDKKLKSIKFYYNVRLDTFLKKTIKERFGKALSKKDFLWLSIKEELGVDFNLNTWINKYNYYIWLYK